MSQLLRKSAVLAGGLFVHVHAHMILHNHLLYGIATGAAIGACGLLYVLVLHVSRNVIHNLYNVLHPFSFL